MLEYFAFMPPVMQVTTTPAGTSAAAAAGSASASVGPLRAFSSFRSGASLLQRGGRGVHPTTLPTFVLFLAGGVMVYQLDQALNKANE